MVQQVGINFVVAPDYLPDHFSHWYLLSSHLQRETEFSIHLHLPANAEEIQELAEGGKMDMLYANAFDAVALIKEKGYLPLVCLKDLMKPWWPSPPNRNIKKWKTCRLMR